MAGSILLKRPGTNEDVSRLDLIRELYLGKPAADGKDAVPGLQRGDIVKLLKEKYNHVTSFQVVFQATANMTCGANADGATAPSNATRGGGGNSGKQIDDFRPGHEGEKIAQSELIRQLLRGDAEKGIEQLSRSEVVALFKEKGLSVAHGTVYQISVKLAAAEDITIKPSAGGGGKGKKGKDGEEGDLDVEGDLDEDESDLDDEEEEEDEEEEDEE